MYQKPGSVSIAQDGRLFQRDLRYSCIYSLMLATYSVLVKTLNFPLSYPNVDLDLVNRWTCKLGNPVGGNQVKIGQF